MNFLCRIGTARCNVYTPRQGPLRVLATGKPCYEKNIFKMIAVIGVGCAAEWRRSPSQDPTRKPLTPPSTETSTINRRLIGQLGWRSPTTIWPGGSYLKETMQRRTHWSAAHHGRPWRALRQLAALQTLTNIALGRCAVDFCAG